MEEGTKLTEKELGTIVGMLESTTKLSAIPVTIQNIETRQVKEGMSKKIVFTVKHPEREETIEISSVQYIKAGKVTDSGIWFNLDKEEKIVKGSALANLLSHYGATSLRDMIGKEVLTVENSRGYLAFKAY